MTARPEDIRAGLICMSSVGLMTVREAPSSHLERPTDVAVAVDGQLVILSPRTDLAFRTAGSPPDFAKKPVELPIRQELWDGSPHPS
jgi:hypothetical protein